MSAHDTAGVRCHSHPLRAVQHSHSQALNATHALFPLTTPPTNHTHTRTELWLSARTHHTHTAAPADYRSIQRTLFPIQSIPHTTTTLFPSPACSHPPHLVSLPTAPQHARPPSSTPCSSPAFICLVLSLPCAAGLVCPRRCFAFAAMGSTLSCISDGTVGHIDAHTLSSYDIATRAIDAKPSNSSTNKRLASSSSLDTHKQSVFSHHATTLQHSARSSLSLAHPFEHLRLQSVDDKEKVEVEIDEQLKTALSSSATSSVTGSPRHVQSHAVLVNLEQQSALSRGTTASSLVVASLSPAPSPVSRTMLVAEQHSGKPILEEYKEPQAALVDSRPTHHQRGFSESSAVIRQVNDAATLTNPPKDAEMSKRSPYTDALVRRIATAVQPSPHHSRRPTLVQPTLAPSASYSSLATAVSPSASPVSSIMDSDTVGPASSAHTLPPSVHLTSINLRIAVGGNQSGVPEPCPSPLDLTRSFSASSSSSASLLSLAPAVAPPVPKADIHHQLDEVLIYRAITAYHREHRDEGLGPSWWTAHSLVVAGSERERERVRRSERIISISGGAGVFVSSGGKRMGGGWDGDSVSGEWLTEEEAMDGLRLMQNPSTIGSFLRGINA